MQLPHIEFAHDEIRKSLHQWMLDKRRAQETFEIDESSRDISRRIEKAADRIHESVRVVRNPEDEDMVAMMMEAIHVASTDMGDAVDEGTDAMIDHCENTGVFDSWEEVCGAVEDFARSAAKELNDLRLKYRGKGETYRSLFFAAIRTMEGTANLALRCRKRGIKFYSSGSIPDVEH